MKITIMGSAAAEAVPSLWCNCDCCKYARKHGGKDIRCRAAYLIDDDTCVDFGPDIFTQSVRFGLDWEKLDRILLTHPHADHNSPIEISWRRKGYSQYARPLELIGSPQNRQMIANVLYGYDESDGEKFEEEMNIKYTKALPGQKVLSGDMEIMPLRALHGQWDTPEALNFIIRRGGHAVLIANDTGFWMEETWQLAAGAQVELAIIDSTCGIRYSDNANGHMGVNTVVRFRDRLLQDGVLKADGIAVANHFSHNGDCVHEKLEAFYTPHNIKVGFDGMEFNL